MAQKDKNKWMNKKKHSNGLFLRFKKLKRGLKENKYEKNAVLIKL